MGKRVPAGAWGTIALTLVGLGIPLALGSPAVGFILIALGVVAGGLTLRAWLSQSATPTQETRATLDEALSARDAVGRRLMTEAAGLQTGDVGVDDDLLRRAGDWVDDLSDALAEHEERDMQKRWMNNPRWSQERPDPITREQWDRYVVGEIRERLALLDEFQREIKARG